MSRRVLVVEDDHELSEVIQYNLTRAGYEVSVIPDGSQALQELPAAPPDLVLLDVMLPGVDGWEVCRFMQGNPALSQIPVIVFTAKSAREDFDEARKFNLAGFFTKPYATTDVLRHVEKVLGGADPQP
jgi:DNA-binding response OmpR family regulator